ncbi:acyltransferase family protein [Flavobacterium johnsoniae]|uniref:Fucose 4-O-acetylase n=1 Tax=Flavobacterium johnsoniae TaxID=986 RepID=A0A1M5GWC5_FLAJO|nr:acyltransferase [Flavobacterium johnsoniae]SHG08074.1 Fucose 4-O-acetylase [Flavobacterium johnsoniae]
MINTNNFNNIRIIALLCILAIHTNLINRGFLNYQNETTIAMFNQNFWEMLMGVLYCNIFKAGTILFFIISGFLFEKQYLSFNNFSAFLKKKTKSLLRPYFIIYIIPTILLTGIIEPNVGVKENIDFSTFFIRTIENIFFSNYWFIPALFVTLIVSYFIDSKNLFKALYLFILIWFVFYLNIYLKFTISLHTVWFIAFFFVFTLGRIMYVYNEKISNWKIIRDPKKIICLVILFYIISNIESIIILRFAYNLDSVNTLRIGNVLYSFCLFCLLNNIFDKWKFTLPIDVSFYFIYLIHPFVLRITSILLVKNNLTVFEYPYQYLFNIIHFLIVLTICVGFQQVFFKLGFKSIKLSRYVFKK